MDSSTCDQHRDLEPEYVRLSKKHSRAFRLLRYSSDHNNLGDISTGVWHSRGSERQLGDSFEVGRAAAAKLIGVSFTYIKLDGVTGSIKCVYSSDQINLLLILIPSWWSVSLGTSAGLNKHNVAITNSRNGFTLLN